MPIVNHQLKNSDHPELSTLAFEELRPVGIVLIHNCGVIAVYLEIGQLRPQDVDHPLEQQVAQVDPAQAGLRGVNRVEDGGACSVFLYLGLSDVL